MIEQTILSLPGTWKKGWSLVSKGNKAEQQLCGCACSREKTSVFISQTRISKGLKPTVPGCKQKPTLPEAMTERMDSKYSKSICWLHLDFFPVFLEQTDDCKKICLSRVIIPRGPHLRYRLTRANRTILMNQSFYHQTTVSNIWRRCYIKIHILPLYCCRFP